MSVAVKTLAQIPVFGQLQPAILRPLADMSAVIHCKRNDILYRQGDVLEGLYAIVSGHIKLYRQSGERTQVLALLRDGDCFGTESLSDNHGSSYAAAAMTSTTLIFFPAQVMRAMMEDYPDMRVALLQLVTGRLRQFADLVHNLAFRDVPARLATVLVARAADDGVLTSDGLLVPRLMTQSELATMVGTAREVIQRTFKKFEEAQLMRVSRKEILILDIERLRQIADEETR